MSPAPQGLIDLYVEAQIAGDMDSEVTVAGNGFYHFAVISTLREACRLLDIELPPKLTNEAARLHLITNDREHEVEYLMGELG